MLGLLGVDQPDHLIDDGSDTDFHQCNNRCFSAIIYLQQSLLEVGMQSFPIPTHLDSILIIQKHEENQSCLVSPTTWSNANHTWWGRFRRRPQWVQVSVTEQFSRTGRSISNGPEWPGDCRGQCRWWFQQDFVCALFQSHPSPSHKSLNKYSDMNNVRFKINTN